MEKFLNLLERFVISQEKGSDQLERIANQMRQLNACIAPNDSSIKQGHESGVSLHIKLDQ